MSPELPTVLVTESLPEASIDWLAGRARVVEATPESREFAECCSEAEGLVVRTYTKVDEPLLSMMPKLRVVGRAGVGLDQISLRACVQRGIKVVYTPEANASAVTELVFGLLLSHLRPMPRVKLGSDIASWEEERRLALGARELSDLTLGVWGMGRVGQRVARAGCGFGMKVLAHDLRNLGARETGEAQEVGLTTLLRDADVLSIHVDGRAANHHLVDAEACSKLKANCILVNASRGFVVDAEAAYKWLGSHPHAHAIFDVHEPEPVPEDHPLATLSNVTLVPHIGAATLSAKARMGQVVEDVMRVILGDEPLWLASSELQ